MNAPVDPDTPIAVQARAWALAVMGEDFPPGRSAEFGAWLKADPRHALAYEQAEGTLMLLDEALASTLSARPTRSPARWIWPGAAAAAGLVAAAVLATPPAAIQSAAGQTREVALADGSHVTLAPASSLRPTWRLARRAYVLQRGEAFFAVRHDPGHPFTVAAGDAKVRVLGTRFDVHRTAGDRVRVEVEQGLVEVARGASVARVGAGQGALVDASGVRAANLIASDAAGAWRRGRLAYAAAPLEDVVADLNRYGLSVRVTTGAASLKVTAGLRPDQAEAFVAGLPRVLPVTVFREADGGLLIHAR
ncbi:FecR domain-containing protein [Caulobacter sp. 1776]|uniref:FecR family protein n=1 Tax=Caulobacter sp. 1776 TaxID=3156420 RepID=UPI0033926BDE